MPQISRNALVMHSAQALFDLVNDIERYPEFLPHCKAAKVISSEGNDVVGSVSIAKGPVNKTFTTRNALVPGERISMTLVDGPFRYLHGHWTFTVLDTNACKVELVLDYEFSSKLIEVAFGGVFKEVANNMVQAFTERAKSVYGAA